MSLPLLFTVDPVKIAIAHLTGHEYVLATVGSGDRVGGENAPPYPRHRITDPPGGDARTMTWLVAPLIQIETLGDLDGHPGKAALRDASWAAALALVELSTVPPVPGEPVCTNAEVTSAGGWSPLPGGQSRYVTVVRLHLHPGRPA